MVVGALFQANLNADKICVDLTYLPDTIENKFWLTIKNQSLVTLYFKIICGISSWSLKTPADGKLGSIGAGLTSTFYPIIERSKPGSETTDSGDLTIEAYTDSGYTTKVAEDPLTVTAYIEDLENWTDVEKSDFDDGTAQGWTLDPSAYMSISNDESVEAGGYSARFYRVASYNTDVSVSKSISLPNRDKVRAAFFFAYTLHRTAGTWVRTGYVSIFADGVKVFDIPFWIQSIGAGEVTVGWLKVVGDLSAYKNQTKTIKLQIRANPAGATDWVKLWFDRIVIAGKD